MVGAHAVLLHVEQAGFRQCTHIGVHVALVAIQRLGQRPNAGAPVVGDMVAQLQPLPVRTLETKRRARPFREALRCVAAL